jgi:hypothetical protein
VFPARGSASLLGTSSFRGPTESSLVHPLQGDDQHRPRGRSF